MAELSGGAPVSRVWHLAAIMYAKAKPTGARPEVSASCSVDDAAFSNHRNHGQPVVFDRLPTAIMAFCRGVIGRVGLLR